MNSKITQSDNATYASKYQCRKLPIGCSLQYSLYVFKSVSDVFLGNCQRSQSKITSSDR